MLTMNDKDLYELSAEADAISLALTALSYQLDNEKRDRLSEKNLFHSFRDSAKRQAGQPWPHGCYF